MTDTVETPANDNAEPSAKAITLTELAAASGLDEDALLQRLADILSRREGADDAES